MQSIVSTRSPLVEQCGDLYYSIPASLLHTSQDHKMPIPAQSGYQPSETGRLHFLQSRPRSLVHPTRVQWGGVTVDLTKRRELQ